MEILTFIQISLCFFVLYIFFPKLCLGYLWKDKGMFYKLFYSLCLGNIAMILIVYVLFFAGIYNRFTLITALIIFAGLSQCIGGRKRISQLMGILSKKYTLIKSGSFSFKSLLINFKYEYFRAKEHSNRKYLLHGTFILLTVLCVGYGLYVRLYPTIGVSFFGISDLYVHLDWLRDMQDGVIFGNGIYPFGYHNIIIAFNTIFPFPLATVLQLWGGISLILFLTGFIFFVCKLFKSWIARLTVLWVFCVSDIFVYFRYIDFRLSQGLPQEYALIFVLPAVIFLSDYLREHKKINLIVSALCLALTALIHFYMTIILILAYLVLLIINFKTVFNRKTILALLVSYAVASVIAATPITVGLLEGIPFEKSIGWALGVTQTAPKDTISNKDFNDNFFSEAEKATNFFEKIALLCKEEVIRALFPNKALVEFGMETDIDRGYIMQNGQNKYVYPILISIIAAVALIAWGIVRKCPYTKLQLWLLLFCILLFILSIAYQLGFPQIIVLMRQRTMLRLMIIPLFGFLPEFLSVMIAVLHKRKIKILPQIAIAVIIILLCYDLLYLRNIATKAVSMQAQYEQTVDVLKRIQSEFPKHTYTVIATTYEMPLVRNEGYHYELIRLLKTIDDPPVMGKQYIPTEYVFIIIEKTVLPVYRISDPTHPQTLIKGEAITDSDGYLPLPDDKSINANELGEFYYANLQNRKIIMAKADLWAKEYKKYFPDEMSVYYEDDDLVVYMLRQDTYVLNNLSIDYMNTERGKE